MLIFFLCLLLAFTPLEAIRHVHRRSLDLVGPFKAQGPASYDTKYFTQRLDHFNVADNRTFQQRYLVDRSHWYGTGPLFVYTGNEGDITWFYNNTVSEKRDHLLAWLNVRTV